MPATRSTAPRTRSKQTRENVSPLASSSKKSFFHPSSSPENLQRARKPQQRERVASPPSDVEVIEISSDDDTPPRNTHDTMIADLRREITKLREVTAFFLFRARYSAAHRGDCRKAQKRDAIRNDSRRSFPRFERRIRCSRRSRIRRSTNLFLFVSFKLFNLVADVVCRTTLK